MWPIIAKTFGGLSKAYYFRQFIFGLIFPVLMCSLIYVGDKSHSIPFGIYVIWLLNTALYPYSRFVYESIVNFIMGENVFFVNAGLMLFVKAITMSLCWSLAILIAPIGLMYLYYHHSKKNNQCSEI